MANKEEVVVEDIELTEEEIEEAISLDEDCEGFDYEEEE